MCSVRCVISPSLICTIWTTFWGKIFCTVPQGFQTFGVGGTYIKVHSLVSRITHMWNLYQSPFTGPLESPTCGTYIKVHSLVHQNHPHVEPTSKSIHWSSRITHMWNLHQSPFTGLPESHTCGTYIKVHSLVLQNHTHVKHVLQMW